MASLTSHQSLEFVKGLVLGNPGAGKTGSLTSLVKAGYKLRVYDFDNLLGSLAQYIRKECPEKIDNVSFQTFTDKMKGPSIPLVMEGKSMKVLPFTDGTPTAFIRALGQLSRWKTETEDFGDPATWGKDTILVVDSLTNLSEAAFRYAQAINPAAKEPQTYYGTAQTLVMNVISLLFSQQVATNVLVLAHINYTKNEEGQILAGWPRAVGQALNEKIAAYFNCVLLIERVGSGTSIRRTIRTNSTGIIDLKNPISFKVADSLPIETGLADFFKAVTAAA